MPVTRDLALADQADWFALWEGYLRFYESNLDPAVSALTFARLLDSAEPMFGLVACEGERVVGIVNCVVHRATWTAGHYCYLEDLFVDPGYRGGGAGRALIEAVYVRADALGCSRVYWLTHETNATARRLYDQVAEAPGFIQYRRRASADEA
jgi:GNAT superfamily N-acetyltransferase